MNKKLDIQQSKKGGGEKRYSVSRKNFLKALTATPLVISALPSEGLSLDYKDYDKWKDYKGFLYDSTKCMGCRACVMACAQKNGQPQMVDEKSRDLSGKSRTAIRMYISEKTHTDELLKVQCMHCLDPACVSACPVNAMIKDKEHGFVYNDPNRCIGCRYCMIACPFNAVKFEWHEVLPKIVKCDFCHNTTFQEKGTTSCVEACPSGALTFGSRKDLLKEAKQRLKDNKEKYYPKVYGEFDGGGTAILYLADTNFEKIGFPKGLGNESPSVLSRTLQETYKGLVAPIAGLSVLSYVVYHNYRKAYEKKEDKS